MLATELNKVVQNVDDIINLINGNKNRYRISVIPYNYNLIYVIINNLNNNQLIYDTIVQANDNEYLDFINTLRNHFVNHGVLISKLTTCTDRKEITYCEQEMYFSNLEMSIRINNKQEQLEAAYVHKQIMEKKLQTIYGVKIKTIQLQNRIG